MPLLSYDGPKWAELRKQLTAFCNRPRSQCRSLHLASPNLAQLLHVSLFSTRHLAHPTLLTVIAVRWCHEALPHSLAYCTTRSGSQQDNAGGRRLWHTASASDQTRRGNRLGPGNAAGHWSAARMGNLLNGHCGIRRLTPEDLTPVSSLTSPSVYCTAAHPSTRR